MTARYTMDQISAFLYDALNEENLSAHQIYETIIETVAEHTEYLQIQYDKSQQLFDLLKGTTKPEAKTEEEPEEYDYDDMTAKGYWMNADGFWMPPQKEEDKVIKWSLPVEEAEDGEYYITFPEDLLEAAKLAPGDSVEWVDLTENTYLLRKVDD
jgi:hypothetical protein